MEVHDDFVKPINCDEEEAHRSDRSHHSSDADKPVHHHSSAEYIMLIFMFLLFVASVIGLVAVV